MGGPQNDIMLFEKWMADFVDTKLIQESPLNQVMVQTATLVRSAILNFQANIEECYEMTLLEKVSLQAMCKFMCVSDHVLRTNIDLVLSLVNSDYSNHVSNEIKQTVVTAIGDFIRKVQSSDKGDINSKIEQNMIATIYSLLRDKESCLRRSSLFMLSHLILSDKILLKEGMIVDICVLLQDTDPINVNLVENLLQELNSKDPRKWQLQFLSAFNRMSTPPFCHLSSRDVFRMIAKRILNYIDVDNSKSESKYTAIIELLCKSAESNDSLMRANACYCLSILPWFNLTCKEKSFAVLFSSLNILVDCF